MSVYVSVRVSVPILSEAIWFSNFLQERLKDKTKCEPGKAEINE
jgi:hypothetical protein